MPQYLTGVLAGLATSVVLVAPVTRRILVEIFRSPKNDSVVVRDRDSNRVSSHVTESRRHLTAQH